MNKTLAERLSAELVNAPLDEALVELAWVVATCIHQIGGCERHLPLIVAAQMKLFESNVYDALLALDGAVEEEAGAVKETVQ